MVFASVSSTETELFSWLSAYAVLFYLILFMVFVTFPFSVLGRMYLVLLFLYITETFPCKRYPKFAHKM